MSKSNEAMMKHINDIVFTENRPFSFLDFQRFEVDGKQYMMTHGTFRNRVSQLMKAGKLEREYLSGLAFYTIKGVYFGKRKHKPARTMMTQQTMTPNHMGVVCACQSPQCQQCQQQQELQQQDSGSNNSSIHGNAGSATTPADVVAAVAPTPPPSLPCITRMIQDLPLDKNSLHDIRLRFEVPDIYAILLASLSIPDLQHQHQQPLLLNTISKDIALPPWHVTGLNIKVTVHRTNTVSVVVGCSYSPIAVDIGGVIRLSNALSRVEERLSHLLDDCGKIIPGGYESLPIPEHVRWNVTMWHFGADASIEYTGEKFSATWEVGENALVRVYSKDIREGKTRIRLERQEYPQKTFADAIDEKLYNNIVGRGGL